MKTVHFTRAVLRSSTTPPAYLSPTLTNTALKVAIPTTFKTTQRIQSSARSFSTTANCNADDKPAPTSTIVQDAPEPASADASATETPNAQNTLAPRHSRRDISNPLDSILAASRTPNRQSYLRRQQQHDNGFNTSGAVANEQGRLARSMGLGASSDPSNMLSPDWAKTYRYSSISAPPPPLRLDAYVGRGEEVSRTRNLASAIRSMEIKLAANKVKRDFNAQKFHERPGLKRKRLKSSRWRARFKIGFKATVQKVKRMTAMGW